MPRVEAPRPWTDEDTAWLREQWGCLTAHELAGALRHPWRRVRAQALAAGLPFGTPPGRENFTAAVARTGYCYAPLVRLCAKHGVALRQGYGLQSGPAWRRHYLHVDPRALDAAIRAELALETVRAAARRHGVGEKCMQLILRRARVIPTHSAATHHRVAPAAVDAALLAHAARPRAGARAREAAERCAAYARGPVPSYADA